MLWRLSEEGRIRKIKKSGSFTDTTQAQPDAGVCYFGRIIAAVDFEFAADREVSWIAIRVVARRPMSGRRVQLSLLPRSKIREPRL
jgi:hypothetical protein